MDCSEVHDWIHDWICDFMIGRLILINKPRQTGDGFLLTFDLGRQDVNNKNNHGMG